MIYPAAPDYPPPARRPAVRRAEKLKLRAQRVQERDEALRDRCGLTKREAEILRLMCDGLVIPQIAVVLGIAYRTVQTHRHRIRAKSGCTSSVQMGAWAVRNGLVPAESNTTAAERTKPCAVDPNVEVEHEKPCTTCHEELPATPEFFWRNKRLPGGLENRCKACCAETPSMKRRRAETPEARRARVVKK